MLGGANFRTFPWLQKQILSNIVSLICCEPQPSNSLCWNFRGRQGEHLAISNLSFVSMCLMPPITMAITWMGQNAQHPRPMSTCGSNVLSSFLNSCLCPWYIFFYYYLCSLCYTHAALLSVSMSTHTPGDSIINKFGVSTSPCSLPTV